LITIDRFNTARRLRVFVLAAFCGLFGAASYATDVLSSNYRQQIMLPRDGAKSSSTPTDLELAVAAHNKKLTENPAPKNRNRIVYLRGPNQYKPVLFPVAKNAPLMDGQGRVLGHLASNVYGIEINFGQHKQINGQECAMAFSANTAEMGPMTGWIALKDIVSSPQRSEYASVLALDVANTPDHGDAPQSFIVSPAHADKWGAGRLKVRAHVDDTRDKHVAAADYVKRPGSLCYLLTSLPGHGGVATDILSSGVVFVPAAGVPRANIPLYLPLAPTVAERRAWDIGAWPHSMEFTYGRVGDRYGWIANANLCPTAR
jgi:hypothetical protein